MENVRHALFVRCSLHICSMRIARKSKADTKAREMKAQYMNGSYFESPEWHEKYVAYLNEHTFEKPKYQSMKLDLLKRFQRREYLVKMILPLFLMFLYLVSYSFRGVIIWLS